MKRFVLLVALVLFACQSWAGNLLPSNTTDIPADSFGPELALNGGFDDVSSWVLGVGWAISGGVATKTAGADSNLYQIENPIVPGKYYKYDFTISEQTGGTFYPFIRGNNVSGVTSSGTYSQNIQSAGGAFYIDTYVNAAFAGSLDNVSVKEIQYYIGTEAYYVNSAFSQAIAGAVISGDTAGVLSIVDIGGEVKGYQIANTGSTDVVVTLTPTKALTVGRHYRPIVIAKRTVGSGAATYKLTGGTAVNITSATFVPLAAPAVATNTTDKPTFTVPAGTTIQFYQPKLLDNTGGGGFNFGSFDFRY